MAVNRPVGDDARKGAVRKRSQLQLNFRVKIRGRNAIARATEFIDQKKAPAEKPYKGVGKEK